VIGCLLLGDSLATFDGLGQHFPECEVRAARGLHTDDMPRLVTAAGLTIISAGTNDPTLGLRTDVARLRERIAGRVIWILPAEAERARIVAEVAAAFGDRVVTFTAGPDRAHPESYQALAGAIRASMALPP
jgi:hypothetical protein